MPFVSVLDLFLFMSSVEWLTIICSYRFLLSVAYSCLCWLRSFFLSILRSCLLWSFSGLPRAFHLKYSCMQVLRCFLTFGEAFHFGPFNLVIFVGTARCEAFKRITVRVLMFSEVDLSSLTSVKFSEIVSYSYSLISFHFSLWTVFLIYFSSRGIAAILVTIETGTCEERSGNVRWCIFLDLMITINILVGGQVCSQFEKKIAPSGGRKFSVLHNFQQ